MKLRDYLPLDKAYHVIVGVSIFALTHWLIGVWSILVVLGIAILKEAYDKFTKKGTPEWLDIVYTVVGGLLGFMCSF